MRFPDAGARDADTSFMGDKRSVLIENLALERNGVFTIRES
jgi:hypothetical protein